MSHDAVIKQIEILSVRLDRWVELLKNGIITQNALIKLKELKKSLVRIQEYLPERLKDEYIEYFNFLVEFYGDCSDFKILDNNIERVYESFVLLGECLRKISEDYKYILEKRHETKGKSELESVYGTEQPLVSILIPTYERPELLIQALESALNQTYPNIEIIVSDNGASDDTELLMQEYTDLYDNVKYYHIPDGDIEDNWKNCWDNMSEESEYVNFLMDDDLFALNKIEVMMDYFQKNDGIALVTSRRENIDIDGHILPDARFNYSVVDTTSRIGGELAGRGLLTRCVNWIGEPTTVLFKREYAEGRYEGWSGEEKYNISDYPLWLRLLEHGDMIYVVDTLSYFRHHGKNDSHNGRTIIKAEINMACMIQQAWNRKIYLKDTRSLRQAIVAWNELSLSNLKICMDIHTDNQETKRLIDELIIVYKELMRVFLEKEPGNIMMF